MPEMTELEDIIVVKAERYLKLSKMYESIKNFNQTNLFYLSRDDQLRYAHLGMFCYNRDMTGKSHSYKI